MTSLVREAKQLFATRDFAAAESKYQEALRLDPNNDLLLSNLAACQLEQNRIPQAEASLKRALAQNEANDHAHMVLGILRFRQQKYDQALLSLTRAAELNAKNAETQNYLGITLSQTGGMQAAEAALRKAIELAPNYAAARHNLAIIYATRKPPRLDDARDQYQRALDLGHRRNPQVEALLGNSFRDPNLEKVLGARRIVESGMKASWSPDAQRIAYTRHPGGGIVVLDLATGKTSDITQTGKDPAWSPDGRFIAFVKVARTNSNQSEYMAEQIWVVEATGGEPRFLAQGGFPGWTADTQSLYFHSRQENRILSISIDATNALPSIVFYQPQSWYPAISPDGSQIAFAPRGNLVIVERRTGSPIRTWTQSASRGALPGWSPDGKRILFGGFDDDFLGLWLAEPDTGQLVRIAKGPYTMPSWSRDGSMVAFDYRFGETREIWVLETKNLPRDFAQTQTAKLQRMLSRLPADAQNDLRQLNRLTWGDSDKLDPKELPELISSVEQMVTLNSAAKYSEAIAPALSLLDMVQRTYGTNSIYYAQVATQLAFLYRKTGNGAEAEQLSSRVMDIYLAFVESDHNAMPVYLKSAASMFIQTGDYVRAIRLLEPAVARATGLPGRDLAQLLNLLGQAYQGVGQFSNAVAAYERAMTVAESALGTNSVQAAVYMDNLGVAHARKGAYDQAALMHERALSTFENALGPDHPDTIISIGNLANLYEQLRNFEKAEQLALRAVKVSEKNFGFESEQIAVPLINLASVYSKRGDAPEAIPLLQLALRLLEKFHGPEHPQTASALNNLALLLQRLSRYDDAEQLLLRALQNSQRLGVDHPIIAVRLGNLAGLYSAMHQSEKAKGLYLRALAIAEKLFGLEHPVTAQLSDDLAVLYLGSGHEMEALTLARRSEHAKLKTLATVLSFTSEQQRLHYQATENPFTVFATLGAAEDLASAVLRRKGIVLDSILEDRLEARASQVAEYRAFAEKLRAAKQQLMQTVLETVKVIPSEDWERHERRKTELVAEIETLESALARKVSGLGRSRRTLNLTLQQVQKSIPSRAVLLEFLRYGHWDKTQPEFRYGVIIIGPSGDPKWISLGNAQMFERNIEQYQAALRAVRQSDTAAGSGGGVRSSHPLSTILETLHRQVWAPIDAALPKGTSTIIISPDAALNSVSFATLLAPDNRFLSQKYSIRYVSSGRDLLKEKKRAKSNQVRIFANPDFARRPSDRSRAPSTLPPAIPALEQRAWRDLHLPPLPGTARECSALEKRAGQWGWVLETYSDHRANEAALRLIDAPHVLHLATHGFFLPEPEADWNNPSGESGDTSHPRGVGGIRPKPGLTPVAEIAGTWRWPGVLSNPMHRSGLALAGAQATLDAWQRGETPPADTDGILTADEVGTLNLEGTELVVLSACDTGAGQLLPGEGVLGLRRGFIQAGAENLLITLWPVSDEVTGNIMLAFYDAFHETENASQALADVQRNWLIRLRQEHDLETAVKLAGPFVLTSQGEL